MPTRNRRQFVRQALWYFLRQDYPNKELVIVDDGEDAVSDLVPGDDRIRYLRLGEPRTLGAKRNFACEHAAGEFIAHWDDDDWNAGTRLSTQLERLRLSEADVSAPGSVLHLEPAKGRAFERRSAPGALPRGPVIYRRSVWQRVRFPDTNINEDRPLCRYGKIAFEADDQYYIKILHPGGTAPHNFRDPAWSPVPVAYATRRLGADAETFGRGRQDATSAAKRTPITVAAPFQVYDGYGSISEYVVLSLMRAGAEVNVFPFKLDRRGLTEEFLGALDRSTGRPASPALCFTWPLGDFSPFFRLQDVVISTMWETSRLPAGWADRINWARAIVVPSRFNARMFRDSGVRCPVEVVPLGIDPAVYGYVERPERPGITALTVGTFVPRKNIEIGISAWKRAFAGDPDARLIIKTRFGVTRYVPDDPRILFVDAEEPTHGIAHWYREADVLLALGNEGFGLPLLEGMATGLPVIALSSEGQGDLCEDARGLVLDVPAADWVRFDTPPFGDCGIRGVPSAAAVAERLRWVAEHRTEARELGKAASRWALRHRSVWSMGPRLIDALERHSQGRQSLRRAAVTVLSAGTTDSEFGQAARDGAAAAGRRVANLDAVPPAGVLDLSYVPGTTDETALTGCVRAARRRGQAVCVTECGIAPAAAAWEWDATLLVAHTHEGVEILRRRWPGKRVHHLPLGCPEPLDDVLAVDDGSVAVWLGETEPSDIADAVRQAGASRVVWIHDRQSLARPGTSTVLLWEDSSDIPRSSYLARICLASGVPVLTSRAAQFTDLREVTHQPTSLAAGLDELLHDDSLRASLSESGRAFCRDWSHSRVARMAAALWQGM